MNKKEPKVISESVKYKGQWFDVIGFKVDVGNGKIEEWENIKQDNAVAVVAVDKNKNVFLGKEYRPIHKKEIYQIVTGSAGNKTSEKELQVQARKELREEFGFDAKNIEKLAAVKSSGRSGGTWYFYLATDLFDSPLKSEDEGESIEVFKMPINEALSLLKKEEHHFAALLGILLAKEKLSL